MNERSMIHSAGPDGNELLAGSEHLPAIYQGYAEPSEPLIDVSLFRGIIFRQRWLIIAVIVLALIGGLVVTLLTTPLYTASATVRVERTGNYIVEGQNLGGGVAANEVSEYMSTLGNVLNSRSLAEQVATDQQYGLRPDIVGAQIDEQRPEGMSDEEWLAAKNRRAAQIIRGGLQVEVPNSVRIITIGYVSENPALAAELANAFASAFVLTDTRQDIDDNRYAKEFLETQISEVREKLRDAELAANAYARNAGLVPASTSTFEGQSTINTVNGSTLSSINSTVAEAKAARIKAEQRWISVQNIDATELPEVQANPIVQRLLSERTALEGTLGDLSQRYNSQFPEVVETQAKIDRTNAQIAEVAKDVKASIRNDFVVARNQERGLAAELNSVASVSLDERDKQVQYGQLEREAQALRFRLGVLLQRYNELASATNAESGAITMLDTALVPGAPTSPNAQKNLILALIAGIAMAGGLALVREFLDDSIRSLEDVENKVGLPLIGHTPFIKDGKMERDEDNQFSSLIESYASIRSTVEISLPRDKNVIQVTSSKPSEGKSTTALILAELFAGLGRRTLLIDSDLRRPSIGKLIDKKESDIGLAEVVMGHAKFEDAIVGGMNENLDILRVGKLPPNPVELLSSREMREFIASKRQEYSMILIDSPPVIGLADAGLLSRQVDATIFVLEANGVRFGQAKAAVKRLRSDGANLLGAVLTKYNSANAGESYGYGYDYYSYGKD